MSDPLSITAGVTGILTTAAKVSSLLIGFTKATKSAPVRARHVVSEVNDVRNVVVQLQSFLLDLGAVDRTGMSLLNTDNLTAVISNCLRTFNELQMVLNGVKAKDMRILDRVKWLNKADIILELIQNLQNQKASFSLILDAFNVFVLLIENSILEVKGSIDRQSSRITRNYKSTISRIQSLERQVTNFAGFQPAEKQDGHASARYSNGTALSFSDELNSSRVYSRSTANRDHCSTFSIDRSVKTFSCLSGVSLAEVSNISVVKLAVTNQEMRASSRLIPDACPNEDPLCRHLLGDLGWWVASTDTLDTIAEDLRTRVNTWYGFEIQPFYPLQSFGRVSVSRDKRQWSKIICFVFKGMIIMIKDPTSAVDQYFLQRSIYGSRDLKSLRASRDARILHLCLNDQHHAKVYQHLNYEPPWKKAPNSVDTQNHRTHKTNPSLNTTLAFNGVDCYNETEDDLINMEKTAKMNPLITCPDEYHNYYDALEQKKKPVSSALNS
ncbi:hypothetical protein ACLMJK_002813 [Lecanora helva]